jgi:membrane fusion protein, multidrug efflux system
MKTGHFLLLLLYAGLIHGARASEQPLAVAAQYREVAQTWSADGVVEAVRQSTVSAQIAGRVKEILFDVGDTVKRGQVILRIDEREAAQAVAGSQAQVMQAQAAMQKAKSDYERARQLFAQKFISQAALDKAQADYKMALAQAAASEAGAQQSALTRGYTAVVAPFGGVVSARLVEVGELVTVGKPLMSGFDPSQMRVIVDVPEYRLADIGAHPQAMIELPSLNRRVRAVSVEVLPAADVRTHSTQIRAYLPANETGMRPQHVTAEQPSAGTAAGHLLPHQTHTRTVSEVYPGMFVRVHFTVGKVRKLLIPASAVVRRSEVVAVYVVDDKGKVRLRQVRLGEPAGQDEIEVLAGLNPGEKVALDPVKAGMARQAK